MDTSTKIKKIETALKNLSIHKLNCQLCPRLCSVNREKEKGYCLLGNQAFISHIGLHFGEEPILSGYHNCKGEFKKGLPHSGGSGAFFFTGCHLKCLYCQNYQISWKNQGNRISIRNLTNKMLEIQRKGALNINLVSPTHMLLPILSALKEAYKKGLSIPLVYNSSGYERETILKNLDGIIDIYLPDIKYFSPSLSRKLSGASNYFDYAKTAVLEMSRQQPDLVFNQHNIAQKGLIIRHLVLPGHINDSINILVWIKNNITNSFGLSLMSQFYPCYKTPPEFQRRITAEEYKKVVDTAQELEFEQIYIQPELFSEDSHLIPDFELENPFRWEF